MKNKISTITLFACAAAGTAFAADPVVAFRADSGTATNSSDATCVGNAVWAADSQELGEKYIADLYSERGLPFTWNDERKAFLQETRTAYDVWSETYYDVRGYWGFDVVAALSGDASFVNGAGATLTFRYSGDKGALENDGWNYPDLTTYYINRENLIILADSAKFVNAGTIRFEAEYTGAGDIVDGVYNGNVPPHFSFFMRDDAVFENSGKIGEVSETESEKFPHFWLGGDAKLVNEAGGEIGNAYIEAMGDAVIENAGTVGGGGTVIYLSENAKFVNAGTFGSGAEDIYFEYAASKPLAGTATFENRGAMTGANLEFSVSPDSTGALPANISASFENCGEIVCGGTTSSYPSVGASIYMNLFNVASADVVNHGEEFSAAFKAALQKSDLNFRNFGVIDVSGSSDPRVEISSAVKLTLAEGSRIKGDLSIGRGIEFFDFDTATQKSYAGVFRMDRDELNIVLTGTGGNEPLISGGLEVCSLVELNVSFADDAVQQEKYVLTVWGGELTLNGTQEIYDPTDGSSFTTTHDAGFIESSLTGTLERFGTTYNWRLDTATGVLTAKDVNIVEVDITSGSQNVSLGAKDVATFDSALTEYSGKISGAGEVHSSGTLNFTGDASGHTGLTSIDAGTFTVAESAKLGAGDIVVRASGTLRFEGARTVANEIKGAGTAEIAANAAVSFRDDFEAKTLRVLQGGTLVGNVELDYDGAGGAVLELNGTLLLNADRGEKVDLDGGRAVLGESAQLTLTGEGGNAPAAGTSVRKIENGARIVIFEDGAVSGDVAAFLARDAGLAAAAGTNLVVYDASRGLSVQVLKDASALASRADAGGFGSGFVAWAFGDAEDALASLGVGFADAVSLSALGGNDPLLNAALGGNAGAARSILNRLSPKSYAAMIAMPTEAFHSDVRGISSRLAQSRGAAFSEDRRWEFFAQAQMISVDNDDASDAPTFDFDAYGVLAGALYRLEEGARLGLTLGADDGEAKIHDGGGKIESADFRLTAFASKSLESFFVTAGAHLGYGMYDVKRRTDYGDADGDTNGWNAGVFADAGTALTLSEAHGVFATPYVGLAYLHSRADSFSESGNGKAAFDVDSLSGDSLRARLGCEISWRFSLGGTAMRLGVDLSYSHEFLDDEIDVDVRASDGTKISEDAYALPEDMFSAGPTLGVDLTENAGVYAGYAFSAGTDSSRNHSANVGFRMTF